MTLGNARCSSCHLYTLTRDGKFMQHLIRGTRDRCPRSGEEAAKEEREG